MKREMETFDYKEDQDMESKGTSYVICCEDREYKNNNHWKYECRAEANWNTHHELCILNKISLTPPGVPIDNPQIQEEVDSQVG